MDIPEPQSSVQAQRSSASISLQSGQAIKSVFFLEIVIEVIK